MDTRKLALAIMAEETLKVNDLVGVDMPILLDAVMSNWQEYEKHKDLYHPGPKDARSALLAIREALLALDCLLAAQYRLREAFALIDGTCSLHEERELVPKEG